jgi:hypothetical protein
VGNDERVNIRSDGPSEIKLRKKQLPLFARNNWGHKGPLSGSSPFEWLVNQPNSGRLIVAGCTRTYPTGQRNTDVIAARLPSPNAPPKIQHAATQRCA